MQARRAIELPPIPPRFGFSIDHELARAEVRRFLEDRSPVAEVRRLANDERGYDPALWNEIARLGWIGLGVPENLGGSGLDALHLALLFEEMGRALLASPFFGTWLALEALRRAGSQSETERLCPPIVRGERIASLAFLEPGGSWEPDDVKTTAEPVPGGFKLSGIKTHVVFGASAHLLVVPAREPSGMVSLFVVDLPSKNVTVEPESALDTTRRMARVVLDGAVVTVAAKLEREGTAALRETFLRAFAMLACEMVGGAERILGLTRDYAISRIQFGRPIGSFQAVKHPIVDAMVGVEQARNLSLAAAVALEVDARRAEPLARGAKAYASDVYVSVAKKGVQLHGGYGFTWDCDVHLWFKRAVVCRGLLGEPVHHRQRIADALLGEMRRG